MIERLEQQIESLIFASDQSISVKDIQVILFNTFGVDISLREIEQGIENIKSRYRDDQFAFELATINEGYLFLSKPAFFPVINQLQSHRSKKRLSRAALETLSIIAYKEPITKLEVEQIRGVNCDYSIRMLLEKELIRILGKSTSVGKPLLYGTSDLFMDHFGINSKQDLPKLKDIVAEDNFIGDAGE